MSKNRSAAFDSHKDQQVTTTNIIAKIVCSDGYTVTLSNHDNNIIYDDGDGSKTYDSSLSANASNIMTDSTLSVDNMELSGALDTASPQSGITAADIREGRFDSAEVYLYEVNYKDLTQGHEWVGPGKYFLGELKDLNTDHGTFRFEVLSPITILKQPISERFSLSCRSAYGGPRCGVILGWVTGTHGTVTEVGSPNTTTFKDGSLVALDLTDRHLVGDTLTFSASGANDGETSVVQSFDASTGEIVVSPALSEAITTSDTWTPENLNADQIKAGTVTSVSGSDPTATFTDTNRTEADGFYEPGVLTWTSGNNNGISMEVKDFTSDTFQLVYPLPYNIQTGDSYKVRPDCTKVFTASPEVRTCTAYGNTKRFRGEPHMPVEAASTYMNNPVSGRRA